MRPDSVPFEEQLKGLQKVVDAGKVRRNTGLRQSTFACTTTRALAVFVIQHNTRMPCHLNPSQQMLLASLLTTIRFKHNMHPPHDPSPFVSVEDLQ